jgi:hypothetical protein
MQKLALLISLTIVIHNGGCSSTCDRGALDFEGVPFPAGTVYKAPAQIYNSGNGLSANISDITLLTGMQTFGSGEIVSKTPHPFGTGQVIHMSRTVLVFDLRQNTQKAEFQYLDQGGTINIGARSGANLFIADKYKMLASMVINGVKITKSKVQDYLNPMGVKVAESGVITLTYSSDIGGMIIGGEELFLDNFCFE